MAEYKLQGLSCANCAREMEEEIQKLENGEDAKVLYNSSKLIVKDDISLTQVEKILANDGAAIVKDEHAHDDHNHTHAHSHSNRMLKTLIIMSAVLYFIAIFVGKWSEGIAITIFIIAAALSGYQTFIQGIKNLFRLKFNIDTLMTIALIGAFGIGEWKEGTLVAILFGINEFLEGLGMEKARSSMEALLKVAPKQATLIANGKEQIVSIETLNAGDIVLVKPGEKIPSDGIVIEGKSSVNEAAITGEPMPVEKSIDESVYGGSINNEGILKISITKSYEDSSLAKILHLVEEAQETKTPTEQFINHFAKYYTPAIIIIAIIVMIAPPLLAGADWGKWFYQGLAVLIVGCPCALVLSSPIAIVSGITRNARNGILIKGGVFLEQLGKIDTIAFDKTGTLTKGEPFVEIMKVFDERFLTIAGSVEKLSSHPLAKAVMRKVEEASAPLIETTDVETLPGQGISAIVNGERYFVGNEKGLPATTMTASIQKEITALKDQGYTLVTVADKEKVLGLMGITDEVRSESKQIIKELHQAGIKHTVMLTGDHQQTAKKVAEQIGLSNYYANLLPDEKVKKIKELTQQGKIAMVGDGINDAPALATADLGIAMGKGTDSAIETADIVLMQDHLGKLPSAVRISKRVNHIIKLNISLALGLKLIALLLTIPGWLTLWIAILSDMGATVLVTLISLTLMIEAKKKGYSIF
ncbi:heavy metal translocating P-type ATPase [Heyndrickxia sporothermodurans]|uniref:Cd(2+)-exporting ATPase n=1 Tax=Heyndrickxia sporothermodurans TaxID=46224 RepID=A0AB37H9J1_9BACI|nr:heavy metal translocating P-type ATPase [Heyndrickxia sporothermodurans]MBL5766739.1 cadmium-translocating P-type ATPase [Heyndrickxia sporothermodurans]MBL5770366.1 cadmium-translocating P-type ATPase [Heyndrickxia sporothermodurans]MBL5774028.1 cadmium-translocating P-type ATPase [Heyndrickxia sporothermodurans]MBL5777674.1 cadmium-translocating P-type ATPase [Heyndrickxia sporothermodurans]MBL5780923.1 cadmium-translocating P-type ATPase [Heyndrickxia sporothermodurans]